jgi:MFS family permease
MAEGTECGNMEKKLPFPTFPHHGGDEDDVCIYEQGCNLKMAKNCLDRGVHLSFFGWNTGLVSGAFTALLIIMSLSAPIIGLFTGKYGPRAAMAIGTGLGVLGCLLLALQTKVWQLYVGYGLLMGLGGSFGGLIPSTTIANNWFRKKVPVAMGIIVGSTGVGGLVFAPVTMILINHVGWRQTYLVFSAVILVLGVIIPSIIIRNRPEDLGQAPDGIAGTDSAGPDIASES